MSQNIVIDFRYQPRQYQTNVIQSVGSAPGKKKRGICVWHRRAGKDLTALNLVLFEALQVVGTYFYFFPTYAQAKKVVWDAMDRTGVPLLMYIPPELITSKNETEMQIRLTNGSVIQFIGTDKIDSVVGTNSIGQVYSEYAIQNPAAWDYMRPILAENGGWALFIYTPRGRTHGYKLLERAKKKSEVWFTEVLTVRDTERPEGGPVVSDEAIQEDRDSGMDEEVVQQEYFCSFDVGIQGSFYSKQIILARAEGRITDDASWRDGDLVYTAWDIGVNDTNSIWFYQRHGAQNFYIIDYYENRNEGLPHYAKVLREKPYVYGRHYLPHDLKVKEWASGKKREDEFRRMLGNATIAKKLTKEDGISAARSLLSRCWFNETRCDRQTFKGHSGLDTLMNYRKEFDEEAQVFSNTPVHDWASNGADAFRTMAVTARDEDQDRRKQQVRADNAYDVISGEGEMADNEYDVLVG